MIFSIIHHIFAYFTIQFSIIFYGIVLNKLYQRSMLNQIIVSSTCCCLQFCCKQLFQTAYKLIGRLAFVKLMYTVIYFCFILFAYFAMYLLKEWEFFMTVFADGISCLTITNDFDCISASVIYRIMLSLFIFSTLMLLVVIVSSAKVAKILNQGLFFSKFSLTVIIFLLTLQLDNSFIVNFSNFSQIFSYIFILWQIIIVIDLSYLWGIKWAQYYSNGSSLYGCLLITLTAINYAIAIGINVYGYILSNSNPQGACENYQNILSTVFIVGMFGIQLLNFNKQNSLLATSAMSVFTSYWLLSAIFSCESCNNSIIISYQGQTVIGKSLFLKINIPVSCIFVVISSFGSIYGSSNQDDDDHKFIQLQENVDLHKNLKPQQQQSLRQQKKMWMRWHLFMMAMSLYISMILTDWGSGDILKGKFKLTPNAQISKIFTSSATFLIYLWTLIAPRLLASRNFQFQ